MSDLSTLLAELRAKDVRLWEQDGRLRYDAPRGAVDDDLRARLRARQEELVTLLRRGTRDTTAAGARGIERIERTAPLPLSYGQQRMWVLAEMLPDSGAAAYVLSGAVHLVGELDADALAGAVSDIVRRHEALRTVVRLRDGEPVAEILPPGDVPLTVHDLGDVSADERAQRVRDLAAEEARRPFDLAEGPLVRTTLVRTGPADTYLLLSVHHICADAWSLGVFFRELSVFYGARTGGGRARPDLPDLPVQYVDYARWQRDNVTPATMKDTVAYWRRRLAGAPALLELPTDRPRPQVQSYRGAAEPYHFGRPLLDDVHRLARDAGATPFMVLLAAWIVVLSRSADADDIVIGTPVAGRPFADVEPLIGFFVNTLVLRVSTEGTPTFRELLDRVRTVALEGFAHQELPFEQLVELLQPERALSHSPLVQHMFIMQNASEGTFSLPGLSSTVTELHNGSAKFDLTLLAEEREDGLHGNLEFATDLFDSETARRFLDRWRVVLEAAVAAPETSVDRLPLLTPAARHRMLVTWNDTVVPVADTTLPELVEARVRQQPGTTALIAGDDRLTYAELDAAANALAHTLRRRGVGPDVLVGLWLPRSPELVVSLLAVLKAGGAYVPLDPSAPEERNALILVDSGTSLVLTVSGMRHALSLPDGVETLCVDELDHADGAATAPAPLAGPHDLAYVLYTSGSTGRPKGVMVEHRNVVNFCAAMDGEFSAEGVGTWLAVTTVSFDISVLELVWTLTNGSTVVLAPDEPPKATPARATDRTVDLSLFYFASAARTDGVSGPGTYRLLLEGARFADTHGFAAVWMPERHFHAFGGVYPNPSVTAAALATVTEQIGLRAGSVVLPLHDPIRVAEEWAVVDNLSGGRVGLSFASGWQADDFVLAPERYEDRKRVMLDGIDVVRRLWRGDAVERRNGKGLPSRVRCLPRPVQPELPVWVTAAGNPGTFRAAGQAGANLLTHLLGQDLEQLAEKIAVYREARAQAGHAGPGTVTLMVHTFVGDDAEAVRRTVREPFRAYLASSLDLVGNLARTLGITGDIASLPAEDLDALLDHAFDRYYETAGLFGTPESASRILDRIADIGVDEVACLIDFGVAEDDVLASLPCLAEARERHAGRAVSAAREVAPSVAELVERHGVTQLQCTPSQAAMILHEPGGPEALARLRLLLVGGEQLPATLASRLSAVVSGRVQNMYGPTETTIWSTTKRVEAGVEPLIGRPIANTSVYVLDRHGEPVPEGVPGELYLGGDGVARGYLNRPELTEERFVPDPFAGTDGARMYRTGDLVRYRANGDLEFLGRTDHQVKVRGYRIELGEIEAVLEEHPGVVWAAATTYGQDADRRLAGYAVPAPGTDLALSDLRDFLSRRLPAYMVPTHVAVLDELPYTPNNKVDRRALPLPDSTTRSDLAAGFVAPRSTTELRLATVWEETLGVRQVGVHDDFFSLGGHSVLAVMLLSKVERMFGRRLPLASLLGAPTLADMARLLDADADTSRSQVVSLRPAGTVPLFVLPGAGGNLVYLRELINHLPSEVAVFGLQPVFDGAADIRAETLVEDMAEQYQRALAAMAFEGPYHLVGHSFGGHVAFELARRLRKAGEEVGLLGIVDSAAPLPGRSAVGEDWDHPTWMATLTGMFDRLFGRDLGLGAADFAGLAEREQVALLRGRLAERDLLPPEADEAQFDGFVRTYLADQRNTYVPVEPYDGTLTFFRAAVLHPDNEPAPDVSWTLQDPTRGWGQFADRVDTHESPGDHLTMLTSPHVGRLAELITAALGVTP